MERRNFIKNAGLLATSVFIKPGVLKSFYSGPEISIHLPGSHSTIKDKSNALKRGDDLSRYFYDAMESFKKSIPEQRELIQRMLNAFNRYPAGSTARNAVYNTVPLQDGNILKVMSDYNKTAATPVFAHLSNKSEYSGWEYSCDASTKVICDDNSLIIKPTDNRPDSSPYVVEEELAYLMKNPKWYCIGLPSTLPQRFDIDYNLKKEIYQKTGKETTRPYYKRQSFAYYGKSVCEYGIATGPKTQNIFYQTDEALDIFFELTHIDACGDPKDLKCKLKV